MEDLTGKRFGHLTALKYDGCDGKNSYWICRCDCGNITRVRISRLKNGGTRTCGCDLRINYKHHMCRTRIYNIWCGIKARCFTDNSPTYKRYGGRGITICDEWNKDFNLFYEWAVSHGYNDSLTIDRIDVNGNYEPSNCRWATYKEQANNRRKNNIIEIDGSAKTLTEWSELYKIKPHTVMARIKRGWDAVDALSIPANAVGRGTGRGYKAWKKNNL